MYKLNYEHHIDSAHWLYNYEGKCANLHGHRWEVKVVISVDRLNDQDMVVDFVALKGIIDKLDHVCLNEISPFDKTSPTAENLACYLHQQIKKELYTKNSNAFTLEVTVNESPNASITYSEASIY